MQASASNARDKEKNPRELTTKFEAIMLPESGIGPTGCITDKQITSTGGLGFFQI